MIPAINNKDAYKIGHKDQYPKGTTEVYSNFTARSGKHSNVPNSKGIYFIGLQYFIQDYLINEWNKTFFSQPKELVVAKYQRRVSKILGYKVPVDHIEALHDLGYLPIIIKALPEGAFVPYGVPMLTIKNTNDNFYWLTNMLESVLSSELWQPITSATTYMAYKKIFHKYAELTGAPKEFIPYQGHDFSFRGMPGRHAAAISGFAVLAAGAIGTDCVSAIDIAEDYYFANVDEEVVGESVSATEHAVMCAGSKDGEFETFERLITEIYPNGIVSVVSDTWDFFAVLTDFLPRLKSTILNRNGKLVIRPDSGDPVEIICGIEIPVIDCPEEFLTKCIEDDIDQIVRDETPHGKYGESKVTKIYKHKEKYYRATVEIDWNRFDKQYYFVEEVNLISIEEIELTVEQKGLIQSLWETFGGTVNDKGFKVLDSHIGAIYGDSITLTRASEILRRLADKGFASNNIVLGIGSYSFQGGITRDTHGMAMKATNVIINNESFAIFKDPKTDDGTKKSAKGYLKVIEEDGQYKLIDQLDSYGKTLDSCLQKVFENGFAHNQYTLKDIRQRTTL